MEVVVLTVLALLAWSGISLILRRARARSEYEEAILDRLVDVCGGR